MIPSIFKIQEEQKSDSNFKRQLAACIEGIQKILNSSTHPHADIHRTDIKIHRIIQALVDTHNEIKDSKNRRSILAGLFSGSKEEFKDDAAKLAITDGPAGSLRIEGRR